MNTDERAREVLINVLTDHNVDNPTFASDDVLDSLRRAGIELFEAAPAKEESQ